MRKLTMICFPSVILTVTLIVVYARPFSVLSTVSSGIALDPMSHVASAVSQVESSDRVVTDASNIARQPEALRLRRRIGGERFNAKKPSLLVMQGALEIGTERQYIQISRRQDARGESVEVSFSGGSPMLSWSEESGARSLNGKLNATERLLLERLTFDTADQFILAQLRGASYQVITRNLRPDDAGEDYSGPLWDVIRVDDSESDEQKRPLSTWRLFYINQSTGLIDKVVSEVLGERMEAQLSNWTERNGEKSPASITWSRGGQTVMTFNLLNVSFASH